TNPSKPNTVAPIADVLLALDKQANEAFIKGDGKFFEGFLSDKFVMSGGEVRLSKTETIKMINEVKCSVKEGWTLTEPQMTMIDNDAYVLSYRSSMEGSCIADGETAKMPSPVRAATIYVRNGEKWQAAFHGENLIVDPTAPTAAVKVAKKEMPKKEKTMKGEKASAQTTAHHITVALMSAERSVWEAWKNKDAKKIEDITAGEISFVNIFGTYFASKAEAIKDWTGATCDVKSFALTDGVGTSVSPTVGILTLTGTADGKCGGSDISGQKIYVNSVYVKDGNSWKWAFGFNSPAM
ncbi:MAG: nuclear transport factor 2 family protein, partial [Pyrinomonadaceae bacterium]